MSGISIDAGLDAASVEVEVIEREEIPTEERSKAIPMAFWIGGIPLILYGAISGQDLIAALGLASSLLAMPLAAIHTAWKSAEKHRVFRFEVDRGGVRLDGTPCAVKVTKQGMYVEEQFYRYAAPPSRSTVDHLEATLTRASVEKGDESDVPESLARARVPQGSLK